jgi:hypothetical protein
MILGTLVSAVFFAAAFLLGGKLHEPGKGRRRSVLSFSAGAAVAYIFVHLSPELYAARAVFLEETSSRVSWPWVSFSLHVATMLGFIVFYGLERFVISVRESTGTGENGKDHPNRMSFRIHLGVFGLYAFLVGHLLVDNLEGTTVPVIFYSVAMGLHFLTVSHSLHKEYGPWFDPWGARLLAAAALAGWAMASLSHFPKSVVALLLGFVSGGVIVNTLITELPGEKEGRFFPFLAGSLCYTVLLLFSV